MKQDRRLKRIPVIILSTSRAETDFAAAYDAYANAFVTKPTDWGEFAELAPDLVARNSIGRTGAAQLLLTAGDNPERLRSEAGFAALCGVSPVPASSGRTVRHRLNRGGDRAANSALHIIAIGRLRTDTRTKAYVARRIAEGHSKLEAIRCLKRYIAREVYTLITQRQRAINQTQIAV